MALTTNSDLYVYPVNGDELHLSDADAYPTHRLLARQADGSAFDLTAATVTVDLDDTRGWLSKSGISATVSGATTGELNFTVAAADLPALRAPSTQLVKVIVTAAAKQQTQVNELRMVVRADV